MEKYIIRGFFDKDTVLYYTGQHYTNTKAFTRLLYNATLFTDIQDAIRMVEILDEYFKHATFDVRSVQMSIKIMP